MRVGLHVPRGLPPADLGSGQVAEKWWMWGDVLRSPWWEADGVIVPSPVMNPEGPKTLPAGRSLVVNPKPPWSVSVLLCPLNSG